MHLPSSMHIRDRSSLTGRITVYASISLPTMLPEPHFNVWNRSYTRQRYGQHVSETGFQDSVPLSLKWREHRL